MTEDRHIFVAEFKYGEARLVKVRVEKETEKTFILTNDRPDKLLGYVYLPGRLSKSNYHCFDTANDALLYLKECADKHVVDCKRELAEAEEKARALGALLEH